MNTTLIVAGRELREKSRIFLICAALAALPFVAAALPTSRGHRLELIPILGGFLAMAMALGLAVVLGGTVVVTELVQRRGSFYFSKPVSPAALWFGKAAAAIGISFAAFVIIALPSGLIGRRSTRWEWVDDRGVVLGVAAAVVVLFLISHVVASMVRSRSAVLGVDFVLLLLTAGALVLIARPLLFGGAFETLGWLGLSIAAAVLLLLAAAPVWQLEIGRTEIKRSHAALSGVLWPGVAVILLSAGAFVAWFVAVEPRMIWHVYDASQPSSGGRMFVVGTVKNRGDYMAAFLIDQGSGRTEQLGAMSWWGFRFSRDGSTAAWMAPAGLRALRYSAEAELHVRRMDGADAGESATGMRFRRPSFVLSDDGSRVAVGSEEGLVVVDAVTRKLLASTAVVKKPQLMFFVNPDLLRVMEFVPVRRSTPQPVRIYEFDVTRRSLTVTGERTLDEYLPASFSADGRLMFLRGSSEIRDGRTGAPLTRLDAVMAHKFASAMLNDGSVAALTRAADGIHLRSFDSAGRPRVDVPLPGVTGGFIAAEIEGGKVLVFTRPQEPGSEPGMATAVIDLNRGLVERVMPGVRGSFSDWSDPRLMRYAADQWLAAGDESDGLVLWKPATGEKKRF